jgi:putative DNA primase/helicase
MSTAVETDSLLGVLPHHLVELRRSGLTDDTIRAAGIRSEVSPIKVAALLDWKRCSSKICPVMVFPFIDADGRNGYSRIKPDRPRRIAGDPVKYESPRGQPNQIYLPPGVAGILDDPTCELLITEGEKKSLCATQSGFPCIGLVGVFGWKEKGRESFLPSLERIVWKDRSVYLVFDSDIVTNENVQAAESRLAILLQNRGAKVRVCRIPEGPTDADGKPVKQGLDDYVVAQGLQGIEPAKAMRTLLDAADEPTALDAIEMKASASMLDPGKAAASFVDETELDGVPCLRFHRGGFLCWHRGAYATIPPAEARAELVRHLDDRYVGLAAHITSDVMDIVKAKTILPGRIESPSWIGDQSGPWPADEILPAKNGLVHVPSLIAHKDYLAPPTPRFFTTSALDYDFRADAPRPDAWLRFLAEVWPDDPATVNALQEWMGYCLTPDTRQQKILLVVGPKRSGKGTIARVQRSLVGAANVAGPTLASLSQNFGLQPMLGKSVAIISDARLGGRTDSQVVTERLLSISGEDAITVDRKFQEPVTAKLLTRLMIFSNELPRLGDSSGALAGRMIVLRMTKSFFGREDHDLGNKLQAEMPGILLWAIGGWRRLRERGRFEQPASGAEMVCDLEDLNSPIGHFLRERCVVADGCRVSRGDIYAAYKEWCDEHGRKHIDDESGFGRQLRAAVPTLRDSQTRVDGRPIRHYEGIGFRSTW